jgi:hypothetical protein
MPISVNEGRSGVFSKADQGNCFDTSPLWLPEDPHAFAKGGMANKRQKGISALLQRELTDATKSAEKKS